jgi:hypothetical protein
MENLGNSRQVTCKVAFGSFRHALSALFLVNPEFNIFYHCY